MNLKQKQWLWGLYLGYLVVLFALSVFLIPRGDLTAIEKISFLLLMILTASMPIIYRGHVLTLFQWVSLAVFLKYGLLVEIVMTQFAIITALYSAGVRYGSLYRIPVNTFIFLITSLVSAAVFYFLGGEVGRGLALTFQQQLVPIFAYAVTFLVVNHTLIHLFRVLVLKANSSFLKGIMREVAISSIMLPLGLMLLYLSEAVGLVAVFILGSFFAGIGMFLQMYHKSQYTNRMLKDVTEYGHELNACNTREKLIHLFAVQVEQFLEADTVVLYEGKQQELNLLNGSLLDAEWSNHFQNGDLYSKNVYETGSPYTMLRREDGDLRDIRLPEIYQSVVSLPIRQKEDTYGVITVFSKNMYHFKKQRIHMLEILVNIFAVAIKNVDLLETTKQESVRDPLTGLYNFRYMMEALKKTVNEADFPFSIILLDLDHFKKINDTYGHQSGNDVLEAVADRMRKICPDNSVISRYGGEEFVILLPHHGEEDARQVGILLQQDFSSRSILIRSDLLVGETVDIKVTASFGIAEAGKKDHAMDLIRKADRAMYNGAKSKGRNRVATYSDIKQEHSLSL
ncbi:sensor domain-containing diguanylate cyclase [Halalkalibacterium halodurans]|uniref:sensor domain-containing diguanylate cyclase n=1 Tax=Halalkalibacterium halodurans TaxID=86665 RepID=UPI002E224713|nr:sensor domain-containing diguanylate cyclase [Halalkalibacterium halodurans]